MLGPTRFVNREISWVRFAERVVELAEDERVELLERIKFLAILLPDWMNSSRSG